MFSQQAGCEMPVKVHDLTRVPTVRMFICMDQTAITFTHFLAMLDMLSSKD